MTAFETTPVTVHSVPDLRRQAVVSKCRLSSAFRQFQNGTFSGKSAGTNGLLLRTAAYNAD